MPRDKIINATAILVQVLRILNALFLVLAILLLIASFPAHGALAARLTAKYHGTADVAALIWVLRAMAVLGLFAFGIADRLLRALGELLATLKAGDPFAPGNAERVTTIAWSLLAWQVLELVLIGVQWLVGRLGADAASVAPSVGGWLSVLVAFVLARVFAAGSRMRDELSTTI